MNRRATNSLSELLLRRDEAGQPRYCRQELRAYLAVLVWRVLPALSIESLSPAVVRLLTELADAVGIDATTPADEATFRLRRYVEERSFDPRMVADVERWQRDLERERAARRRSAADLIGTVRRGSTESRDPAGKTTLLQLLAHSFEQRGEHHGDGRW